MKFTVLLQNERVRILLLLLVALSVLAFPFVLRYPNGSVPGQEPYYHLRLASQLREEYFVPLLFPHQDPLVYGERIPLYTPYHVFLALFQFIFPPLLSLMLLQAGIFCCTIVLFHAFLKQWSFGTESRFFALFAFILSPLFLSSYGFFRSDTLAVLFLLGGMYFTLQKKTYWPILSGLFFLAATTFGGFHTLLAIWFLFFLAVKEQTYRKQIFFTILLLLLFTFLSGVPFFPTYRVLEIQPLFTALVSDFGGFFGVGTFTLVLSLIGFFILWKERKQFYGLYLSLVLLAFVFLFGSFIMLYAQYLIALFAGVGLWYILSRDWNLQFVKYLTLVLIFCGLVFSTLSYADRIAREPPTEEFLNGLAIIGPTMPEGAKILSLPERGFAIAYAAKRPVYLDGLEEDASYEQKLRYTERVFRAVELERANSLLAREGITHIVLDPAMRQALWNQETIELAYLFRNNESFKNLSPDPEAEIFEVIREDGNQRW